MLGMLLALSAALAAPSQAPSRVPEPAIDVYTFGPGAPLFERFGHAAVCVTYDDEPGRSRCYNYGTTDFGSPPQKIGLDFLLGRARFWVSVSSEDSMISSYLSADRSIWRQRLPLQPDQVARIAAKLQHDAQPENREYVYHHLNDNCSTRVRDATALGTGAALRSGPSLPARPADTFRALGRRALHDQTALILIADVFVGRPVDRTPDEWQAMFLPDALREGIATHLHAQPELLYRRRAPLPAAGPGSWPVWSTALAVMLCAVALPLGLLMRARRSRARATAERVLLTVAGVLPGLVGLMLWLVAAVTTVPELRWNEALLVFVPMDLALPFLTRRLRLGYARWRTAGLLAVSLLLGIGVLRQPLLLPALLVAAPMLAIVLAHLRRSPTQP